MAYVIYYLYQNNILFVIYYVIKYTDLGYKRVMLVGERHFPPELGHTRCFKYAYMNYFLLVNRFIL